MKLIVKKQIPKDNTLLDLFTKEKYEKHSDYCWVLTSCYGGI